MAKMTSSGVRNLIKMSLPGQYSAVESFSFGVKMWALMCQRRLDLLMTIMAGGQLKGMCLKNI